MSDMLVRSKIKLNLLHPNSGVVVYAKQFDKDSRVIDIDLVAGSEVWDPPHDCEVVVMYAKPDGTKGIYDKLEDNETSAVVFTGIGSVRLTLAEQALTVAGNVFFEISFYTAELRSTTLSFILSVESGVPKNEDLVSESYFNILSTLIQGLIGATANPPQIDPDSGYWKLWDEDLDDYVVTTYPSRGPAGPMDRIGGVNEMYAVTDNLTRPTSGWSSSMPSVAPGKFLWTRVEMAFENSGDSYYTYFVAYQGQNGDGSPGTQTPLPDEGAGAVGDSSSFAHEDHVHPMLPPSANGSAAEAEHTLHAYSSINDLNAGFETTPSTAQVWDALPEKSVIVFSSAGVSDPPTENDGFIEILKNGRAGFIEFHGNDAGDPIYQMSTELVSDVLSPTGTWRNRGGIRNISVESIIVPQSPPISLNAGEGKSVLDADIALHEPQGYDHVQFTCVLPSGSSCVSKGFNSPYFVNASNTAVNVTQLTYRYLCWNDA